MVLEFFVTNPFFTSLIENEMLFQKRKLGRGRRIMGTKEKRKWEKRNLFSVIFCLAELGLLLFLPWIQAGSGGRYSLPGLAVALRSGKFHSILEQGQIMTDDPVSFETGLWIGITFFILYGILLLCHIVNMFLGKSDRLGVAAAFAAGVALSANEMGYGIGELTSGSISGALYPSAAVIMRVMELMVGKLIEEWKDNQKRVREQKRREQERKQEKTERLWFPGKYNRLFYRVIWKDFKENRKDYLLFFICSSFVFCFIFAGLGMRKALSVNQTSVGSALLDSVNKIVMNTIIPIGIVSVFMIVLLLFYYLRQRTQSYGMFLTLGIRKKTLYLMAGIEFFAGFFVAVIAGTILGLLLLAGFVSWLSKFLEVSGEYWNVSAYTWFQALGILLLIYLVSFMAAHDIYASFGLGKSGGVKSQRERMPVRRLLPPVILGVLACLAGAFCYSRLYHYENVLFLLLCFVGLYLVLRYGMAKYLLGERKTPGYLNKLLKHQQMYHRSKSAVRYLIILTVIQTCVLFYFPVQVISSMTAEDTDGLFPYDIVCFADEEDEELFERLQAEYEVEVTEYPMVRISSYQASVMEGPQGQHIGISESTYHALKKELDPDYEEKSLALDEAGEKVYIVYQQDKSADAKPVDYYMPKTPLLHVGPPAYMTNPVSVRRKDTGYNFEIVQGEEMGSLTGIFHQGRQENLIVVSDAYFEKAKEFWKARNIWTGEVLPEEMRIEGVTTFQGPTKLVLLKTSPQIIPKIMDSLWEFSEKHIQEESKAYRNQRLSLAIKPFYTKAEGVDNLEKERMMKISMNGMVMGAFVLTALIFLAIKMLTEQEDNQRRAEFFQCMGMRRKDRIALLRREIFSYCYIPFAMAVLPAAGFTTAAFHARMYTAQDITRFLTYLVPFWIVYIIIYSTVVWVWATVYARKTERRAFRHDS